MVQAKGNRNGRTKLLWHAYQLPIMRDTLRVREQPMKRYLTLMLRSSRLSEPQPRIARLRHFTIWAALFVITTVATGQAKADNINNQEMYKLYAHMKVLDDKQYRCVVILWRMESNWSPTARNSKSTAFGIPQLLKMKETNPFKQIDLGLKYIDHRYNGDTCKALAYHKKRGHY